MQDKLTTIAEKLESIITRHKSKRGMENLLLNRQLLNTAMNLNESETVIIVTGFYIMETSSGEIDGPIGSLSIAYALEKLQKNVVFVTDCYTEPLLMKGVEILELKSEIKTVNHENSRVVSAEIMALINPDHLIAIERPGKSEDGRYHSMNGDDISAYVPDLDYLFNLARYKCIETSAIGDGGNEIGMGKVADYIIKHVKFGPAIYAVTETDNLIVADTSNWGAHALSAMLSILNGKMLIYDEITEMKLIRDFVEKGAVDGLLQKSMETIDGYSIEENLKVFSELKFLVEQSVKDTL